MKVLEIRDKIELLEEKENILDYICHSIEDLKKFFNTIPALNNVIYTPIPNMNLLCSGSASISWSTVSNNEGSLVLRKEVVNLIKDDIDKALLKAKETLLEEIKNLEV